MMRAEFQILEEDLDENYEPTRDEIIEYATYLGMSPRSDTKYFHIAREGLKTPLPTPWKPAELKNGDLVYYNPATKVLQQDHPLDEYFRRKYIEEKKKDAQTQQPSKTSKKLKGLCEQLREPPTLETTQKTEKKVQQSSDFNFSNTSQLNESFLQQELDRLDVQQKIQLEQYEREQESFVLLYKMNRQKKFEEEKQEIEQSSFNDSYISEENIPEKSIKIRQKYLNQKEQLQKQITQEIENKYLQEKKIINEESNNRILEYRASKQIKLEQKITQNKNDWENKLQMMRQKIIATQQELQNKKTQLNKQLQQQQQQLQNKWQKLQIQCQKEIKQQQQDQLKNLEYQYKQKQNEIYEELKQKKMKQSYELKDQYDNSELQVRKRWRDSYKEKLQLFKVNLEHDLECELKIEELKLKEEMTNNFYKYKNLLRTNLVKIQQQQFENERTYLTNYYKEQLQAIKAEYSKRNELEIQKLELSQMVMSNESFTQLEKSQPKPQFNPDLRIKKKELELQIKELQNKINDVIIEKNQLIAAKQETEFMQRVMTSNNKIDFLKQSISKQDEVFDEIKKKAIQKSHYDEGSFHVDIQKSIRKDQWEFQIEQEQQWLSLQKERLKYDKKKMSKIYENLNSRSSTNDQIDTYNKCVNTIRNNQQILKNCEYIINKLSINQKQYKQTKIIQYLKENDTLIEDLNLQKSLIESVPEKPIEIDYYYSNHKFGNQSSNSHDYNNLLQQTFNQKQILRDIRDNLNKSMQSRLG